MASQAPAWWWAVGLLALAQLLSFGLIASQHATIQQLRGEAPTAALGRRLLQAQVGAAPAAPADLAIPLRAVLLQRPTPCAMLMHTLLMHTLRVLGAAGCRIPAVCSLPPSPAHCPPATPPYQPPQPSTAATNAGGGLPSGLLAFEGGRLVIKAHVVIQPTQSAVDSYYGAGTFRASQPALQIDQALLSAGSAGASADAAAAPAIATQSPTQPVSLQGPLTANTVTASTLQTTAGGALMSGGAVVAGTLQTTGAAAVLSGGSLTCGLVTAEVLQTTDTLTLASEAANGTASGAQQQQQQQVARGVTISGGVVSAAAVQGDTVSSTGVLQGASLDVGSGSITAGSLTAQRIAAPSGTVTCATMLAQNAAVNAKLTAADVTVKGDALCEWTRQGSFWDRCCHGGPKCSFGAGCGCSGSRQPSRLLGSTKLTCEQRWPLPSCAVQGDAEVQGVTTLGRKASTQPALNVLGTARTAVLQASAQQQGGTAGLAAIHVNSLLWRATMVAFLKV